MAGDVRLCGRRPVRNTLTTGTNASEEGVPHAIIEYGLRILAGVVFLVYWAFFVFALASLVVAVIGWFAVLFTGAWPRGMRDFLVRVTNYYLRIWAYVAMVVTDYPRFGLD